MKAGFAALLIGLAATGFVAGCGSSDSSPSAPTLARDTGASLATTLEGDNFSTLRQLLQNTDALAGLEENQRITVMAPTNDAFDALFTELGLSDELRTTLLSSDPATPLTSEDQALRDAVGEVLLYHVIAGEYLTVARDDGPLLLDGSIPTVQGTNLTVNRVAKTVIVADAGDDATPANIVAENVWVEDGVVHVIDRVLLPAF
jgi:transforming growth factor-beta-induced protein